MQGSACSSREMNHREGQRRGGFEGKLCFWKQHFHGLWQDVLCTSSDGARAWAEWWKMGKYRKTEKQKKHTENWLFILFWTVRVMWKNTSFAPSHLSNIFDNKVCSQERKGTSWEVFSLQFWTKPVPYFFHLQSCRKMLFFPQLGCKCFPDCFYLCKKTCEDLGRFCELIKSHISWALSFSLNSPSILSGIQYTNDNFLA